jgi:RsiW-degrading membrane proteinase PrsW (M82 family)
MTLASFVLIVLIVALYLLPTFIARPHGSDHQDTIFINLLFGWTVLGWIAALIWAIVEVPMPSKPRERSRFSEPFYK